MPTPRINPKQGWKVVEEVEIIYETVTSSGNKVQHEKLVQLLVHPNNAQRQELLHHYRTKYGGTDLVEELKRTLPPSEVATNQLLLALLDTPAVHDAKYLNKAMKGLGTNEDALIEILVTRSNSELTQVKRAYKELYGHDLEKDISAETSGCFKTLLLDLLEANRDQSVRTDQGKAFHDAKTLYEAGEKKWGTDEAVFVKILANQNLSQLHVLFNEYEKISKKSLEQAIKSEFSGEELNALLAICSFVRNGPVGEVAELLHKCIQKGAKDETLVHLVVSHAELDLGDIADEYKKRFHVSLEDAIEKSGKSSTLKRALVLMIKGNK